MRYTCDFIDGPVTDRLLGILREQDAKTITTMLKAKKFRIFRNTENVISAKTLLPDHICDYIEGTGYTLIDVFYGVGSSAETEYTSYDSAVIDFLNSLSLGELEALYQFLQNVYPNEFYYIGSDMRPSQKLREIMLRMPRGSLQKGNKTFNMPGVGHLSEEAKADIAHYNKLHAFPNYTFDVNCMPELAEFVGVSLHWIWNLTEPLYCNTQIADCIFDFYTMMQPSDQLEFLFFIPHYHEDVSIEDLLVKKDGEM